MYILRPLATASRAREIRRSKHDPKPARSEAFPDCLPDLSRTDPVLHKRVMLANALYRLTGELFREAHRGIFCSIGYCLRSHMWETSYLRTPLTHLPCLQSVFDHCQYGGLRPKSTLLKHNMPNLSRLNRCDGSQLVGDRGGNRIPSRTVSCVGPPCRDQLLELGARPLPSALAQVSDDHVAASRVATSAQPSRSLPPVVPEFQSFVRLTGSRKTLHASSRQTGAFRPQQRATRPFAGCQQAPRSLALQCVQGVGRVASGPCLLNVQDSTTDSVAPNSVKSDLQNSVAPNFATSDVQDFVAPESTAPSAVTSSSPDSLFPNPQRSANPNSVDSNSQSLMAPNSMDFYSQDSAAPDARRSIPQEPAELTSSSRKKIRLTPRCELDRLGKDCLGARVIHTPGTSSMGTRVQHPSDSRETRTQHTTIPSHHAVVVGIPWLPEDFVKMACRSGHPKHLCTGVPRVLADTILANCTGARCDHEEMAW